MHVSRTTFAAPEARTSFVPLSRLLPGFLWPEDQFEGGAGVLDRVYATGWSAHPGCAELDLFTETEVALRLPGVDGLELVLGAPADATGPGIAFGLQFAWGDDGHWSLTLTGLAATLRWDGDLLVAMRDDGQGGFTETGEPYGVTLNGSLTLTDDWGLSFDACPAVELPPVRIGGTGVIVRADDVRFHFASTPPPPELAALGYGEAFRGIYLREAEVILPASWGGATGKYTAVPPALESATDASGQVIVDADGAPILVAPDEPVYFGPRITFANCAIGTGGFSGDLAFDVDAVADLGEQPIGNLVTTVEDADRLEDAPAGVSGLSVELFGFGLALRRFQLGIRRNAVVSSAIDGSLRLPFLDSWFDTEVAVAGDGAFEVSLATASGAPLVPVTIEQVVELLITSIGIDDPGGGAPVGVVVDGTVRPLLDVGGQWPELDLHELRVFADGSVALTGGWLKLPTQQTVDFFGFQLELSSIGFGTGELVAGGDTGESGQTVTAGVDKASDWRWIGLSGAIRLVDELALAGSVEGLKIAWRPLPQGGFEWDWSLSGIGVSAETDAFSFNGSVAFIDDPDGGHGFRGAIALSLATLGLGFDAEFVVGRTAEAPAGFAYWGVVLGVDLPAGIPLGPTGIAFYGLKGLGSQNLTPARAPAEEWYDGWYKKADLAGQTGVTLAKFEPEKGALGFGLGVTLGTAPDNGFTVNTKALALLLFPGPTILIAGKAAFLAPRSALDGSGEPPFESLLVIEGADGSVLLNVAANYPLIDERVLSISGDAEAYFSAADPADWHLDLGRKPLEDRISVKALSLFEALGYLTIDQKGLATGFQIGFGETWRFGRLSLGFDVHISGDGSLSFDPVSVAGHAELAGAINACAFGVCLGISASAGVGARAFDALSVSADMSVEIDLPFPLPTLSAEVELSWRNQERPAYADPFTSLRLVHATTAEEWEPAAAEGDAPFVPMDARPVVTFSHAVADRDAFGQPAAYVSDPAPESVGDYEVSYTLTGVSLQYRPVGGHAFVPVDDLYGVWLLMGAAPADDPAEAETGGDRVTTKLEVWGRTPFSYEDHTTVATLSTGIVDDPAFPCGTAVPVELRCADWLEVPARTRYPFRFGHEGLEVLANRFTEVALEPSVGAAGLDRALALPPGTVMIAALPGPCVRVATLVESLASCTVEAWGRRGGVPTRLASRSVGGRSGRSLEFEADGIEWLVYRAESSDDCGPWSWQLADSPSAARVPDGRPDGAPGPGVPDGAPGAPGVPDGAPGGGGVPGHPDPEIPEGEQAAIVPDDPNPPRPITTVPCCSLLYQVCWTEEALVEAADRLTERRQSFSDWTEAWAGSARVLGPNTTYQLAVTVEASGIGDPATFTRTVYFQTSGPPGFLADGGDGKGQLLGDLGLYVDRTAPPAGAGLSLEAPPHYRDHDVVVLYNRDNVKSLYAGKLFLQLVDANGTPVAGPGGRTLFEADFTDPANRVLTTGETVFLEAIDGATCSSISSEEVMPSDSQGFDLPTLAPATLYQARVLGGWSGDLGIDADGEVVVGDPRAIQLAEVWRWEFVTSRYESFSAHAGSYDGAAGPWDGPNAVVGAGGTLDEAAVAAQLAAVQAGQPEWDEAEKAAADELLDLLGVRAGTVPPARLELTVVRDGTRAVGLMVDSPEPFDWARITVAVRDGSTGGPVAHTLVRGRDGRRALLFRRSDGATLRPLRPAELSVELTYDLAVAPARYSGGGSGAETATLAVTIAEEAT